MLGDSGLGFDCGKVYEFPAGTRSGCLITSARQSFLKTSVPMPGKIFDARRDFGARGDGRADDTAAVQRAIDAARKEGNGAMAYLPAGAYKITGTLEIGGANWSLAGAAVGATRVDWAGPAGGTLVHVADPEHITIENIAIGGNPNSTNDEDILQTTTGANPSFITYDRVYVYSASYLDKSSHPAEFYRRRGLHCQGLGKDDTVLVTLSRGQHPYRELRRRDHPFQRAERAHCRGRQVESAQRFPRGVDEVQRRRESVRAGQGQQQPGAERYLHGEHAE